MQQTFTIGPRLKKYKYISIAVNSFLVFTFYFIYRFLFESAYPTLVGTPLLVVFLAVGALIIFFTRRAFDAYARSVSYELTEEGLLIHYRKQTQLHRWADFRAVSFRDGSFQNVYPVEFALAEGKLMLNQHLQGLCRLTYEIFLRIEDHVDIPPELMKKTRDMIDIY